MIEATVRQKDSNTHTKFLILPNGGAFPEDNFQIAKEWYDQKLLSPLGVDLVETILDIRDKVSKLTTEKVVQIEV